MPFIYFSVFSNEYCLYICLPVFSYINCITICPTLIYLLGTVPEKLSEIPSSILSMTVQGRNINVNDTLSTSQVIQPIFITVVVTAIVVANKDQLS